MQVTLPDGWIVNIDYDVIRQGSPDSYWEPGDPPEFNVHTVWHDEYGDCVLTDDEHEVVYAYLCEHYVPDYHDFEEC